MLLSSDSQESAADDDELSTVSASANPDSLSSIVDNGGEEGRLSQDLMEPDPLIFS